LLFADDKSAARGDLLVIPSEEVQPLLNAMPPNVSLLREL
jgi:hypothetical protein